MPLTDVTPLGISFECSAAAELLFLLRRAAHDRGSQHVGRDETTGAAGAAGDLWPDLLPCWELLVLAHEAGVLTGALEAAEIPRLFGEACERVPRDLPLRSEPPADRRLILDRLARLRHDVPLRERYLSAVGELWSSVQDPWRETSLPMLTRTIAECQSRAGRGDPWQAVFQGTDFSSPTLEAGLERARAEKAVVAVCAYGGSFTIDLPGAQFFAFTIPAARVVDRARSEVLARRLRALADPTRLALLRLLVERPRQIGELAAELGVSQPTVSNHVKVLRDAGLLAGRAGERKGVFVDDAAVCELLAETARHLGTTAH